MTLLKLIQSGIGRISEERAINWGDKLGKLAYFIHEKGEFKNTIHQAIAAALSDDINNDKIDNLTRKHFIHLGRLIFEISRLEKLRDEWSKKIIVEGIDHLERAQSLHKGVILLTAHLGNFELMLSGLSFLGIEKPYVIAWKQPNTAVNNLLDDLRTLWGTKLIFTQDLKTNEIGEVLHNQGAILIALDRYEIGKTKVDFFGFETGVPAGPFLFARKFHAPIVPLYTFRRGVNHKIIVNPPLDLDHLYSEQWTIDMYLQNSIKMIEEWVKENPEQWMWIFKRNEWY